MRHTLGFVDFAIVEKGLNPVLENAYEVGLAGGHGAGSMVPAKGVKLSTQQYIAPLNWKDNTFQEYRKAEFYWLETIRATLFRLPARPEVHPAAWATCETCCG